MNRIYEPGDRISWMGRIFSVSHMPRKGAVAVFIDGAIRWLDVREVVPA